MLRNLDGHMHALAHGLVTCHAVTCAITRVGDKEVHARWRLLGSSCSVALRALAGETVSVVVSCLQDVSATYAVDEGVRGRNVLQSVVIDRLVDAAT